MASENPLGGPTITGPDGHVLHLPAPENPVAATYRKFVIDGGVLKTSTHFGTDAENKGSFTHDVHKIDRVLAPLEPNFTQPPTPQTLPPTPSLWTYITDAPYPPLAALPHSPVRIL